MQFNDNEKRLIELALNKAQRGDGEFAVTALRLDGTLRKNGAKAYLIVEPGPAVEKPPSSAGCTGLAIAGFIIFVVVMGLIGSQHTQPASQDNQATVEATPTPEVEATATPTN
jgi:hypothetical protein